MAVANKNARAAGVSTALPWIWDALAKQQASEHHKLWENISPSIMPPSRTPPGFHTAPPKDGDNFWPLLLLQALSLQDSFGLERKSWNWFELELELDLNLNLNFDIGLNMFELGYICIWFEPNFCWPPNPIKLSFP